MSMSPVDPASRGRSRAARRSRRLSATVLITTVALGVSAAPSSALETLEMGAANNVYPAMKELAPFMASSTVTTFTFEEAGQAGGWWRADKSHTLRGITSGNLRKQIQGQGAYTAPGAACSDSAATCQYGPLGINGFFSADLDNVKRVVPNTVDVGTANNPVVGTCVVSATGQGLPAIQACPGDLARAFVTGKLALYSCSSTYAADGADPGSPGSPVGAVSGSGNGEPGSPRCEATPMSPAVTTMAGLITYLDGLSAASSPGMFEGVSIALPTSAPFGAAAKAALEQADTNDSNPATFTYNDTAGDATQTAWPAGTAAGQCEHTGGPVTGAKCLVRLEAGISQVRGAVTSASKRIGLAALSNLKKISWTSGSLDGVSDPSDDPNPFTALAESAYTANGPIKQFAVRLDNPSSAEDTQMGRILSTSASGGILSTTAQSVFTSYGYTIPTPF